MVYVWGRTGEIESLGRTSTLEGLWPPLTPPVMTHVPYSCHPSTLSFRNSTLSQIHTPPWFNNLFGVPYLWLGPPCPPFASLNACRSSDASLRTVPVRFVGSFFITAPLKEDAGQGSGEVTLLLIMAVSEGLNYCDWPRRTSCITA